MSAPVVVARAIAAPPRTVWELVANLTRMPEWSPENRQVDWLGETSQAALGARFRGTNQNGPKTWKSTCEITKYEPGSVLAFRVKAGPFSVSKWTYTIVPATEGSLLTQSWTDERGRFLTAVSKRVTGVDDRIPHNRRGMQQTLANLASAAEQLATTTALEEHRP